MNMYTDYMITPHGARLFLSVNVSVDSMTYIDYASFRSKTYAQCPPTRDVCTFRVQ